MRKGSKKTTFALFFGNRGFFPGHLIMSAREEMDKAIKKLGYDTIMLDAKLTRHGGVETPAEGETYANFLKKNEGKYDGVILCLPNFGDENGAMAALKHAGVPILVQAYPDDLDKMAPELRRDAYCGKMSIMDVFHQAGVKFTVLKPHTVAPTSKRFAENVDHFARVCRVANGFKDMVVGALGARTSAFKTVRIDETALQANGITMETFDLSDIFAQSAAIKESEKVYKDKAKMLKDYSDFSCMPEDSFKRLTKLGIVIDRIIEEYKLDTLGLRCWVEMQQIMNLSPCVLLSELNNRGIPAACEVDIGNAVAMYALSLASGDVATCLDWNNNYGDDDDKCILFHCGPVPQKMMTAKGTISDHAIISNTVGKGCSYGCNVGRIKPAPFTFASMLTEEGKLKFYIGEGKFTKDPIPAEFFGCAGVGEIRGLQDVLLKIGKAGHRHHVSATPGHVMAAVQEALESYLGYEVSIPQE